MSASPSLERARRLRAERLLDAELDRVADELMLSAKTTGPYARHKLRFLLRYYAKKPHPFRACVRDNRKRFGPRTEAVCATLKDIIRGTTKWRGHKSLDKGAPGLATAFSEEETVPISVDEVIELIDSIPDDEFEEAFGRMREIAMDHGAS